MQELFPGLLFKGCHCLLYLSELPNSTPQRLPVAIATIVDDMAKTIVARATLRAKCAIQKATLRGEHSWLGK